MKKNIRTILASAMALCIFTSMTGCGDSEKSEKSSGPYAYYDLLSKEYEKNPPAHYPVNNPAENACIGTDGKIYATVKISEVNHIMISYDTETKETKTILPEINDICYFYCDGYAYSTNNDVLTRYDTNGNIIQTGASGRIRGNVVFTEDGSAFFDTFDNGIEMLSPDFQTVTQLSEPQVEIEHGLTEDAKNVTVAGAYKNKVFAYSYTRGGEESTDVYFSLFALDTSTLEWHKCADFEEEDWTHGEMSFNTVGRFLLGNSYVFDMEDEKVIARNASAYSADNSDLRNHFSSNYVGGDYSIIKDNSTSRIYKGKYASDNTPIDLDDCKVLTAFDNTLTGNVILLDTNRYIVNDDYGVFLCTYDKGETEEEVIMQF